MSTNIIDALVVVLGLDSKDLDSKQRGAVQKLADLEKAADKTEKSVDGIGKASKKTARDVDGLSRTVSGLLAIIGGTVAIKSFISDFIDTNAQLDRLSKNLGIGVSVISAWSNAAEKTGGSAQGLQTTFDMLSKSQTQLMLTGESSLLPYFSALGVSLADVNGKARPVTDILLDLSDRFSHMDRVTANNLGRMLGIDQGTLNLLLQGRKEVELEIRRQKEQTAVTAAQAAQAQKFQIELVGMRQKFQALGRALLMEAAPYIEKLLDLLQRFVDWMGGHKQFVEDFLKVMAVGLGAIAIAAAPITLTVAAVVALAGAIALLWEDYQVWKKGGDSLIDWGKWEPGIEKAIDAIGRLRQGLFFVVEGARLMNDIISGNFAQLALDFKALGEKNPPSLQSNQNTPAAIAVKNAFKRDANGASYFKDFFKRNGWTDAQASGITANLLSESGGFLNAVGDHGQAYGLAQWHPDRQAAFKKWSGKDIRFASLDEQLGFVNYELTQGGRKSAGDRLRATTSARDAGAVVSQYYESPADVAGNIARRGSYAETLAGIPGAASTVQSAPTGGGGSGSGDVDRSVKTDIGTIVVQTQATDAAGIARDLKPALDYLFTSQANYGLVP